MQLALFPSNETARLRRIHRLLAAAQAQPETVSEVAPGLPPISQLVRTMLGGRTQDAISWAAYRQLRRAFPDWAALANASPAQLLPLIANVTHAEKKAKHVPLALTHIVARRGALDLTFLDSWPVLEAIAWLRRLPGVGPKAAASVLNFSTLNKRALVVDTHHLRVMTRIGVLPEGTTDGKAFERLMPALPEEWDAPMVAHHHLLVKSLSQNLCTARTPDCPSCPLSAECKWHTRRPKLASTQRASGPPAPGPSP